MKLDIPYYIRQVLREKRMVSIPGIGTLKLEQNPAKFNDSKTIISPPFLNISFDDNETNDPSLLKYILDTGLMSEEKAIKQLDQYTQSAFNKLLNVDSLLIDGIGTIRKSSSGDVVDFEPNLTEFTKELQGLKPINLSPIARIVDQNKLAAIASSKPEIEESRSFIPRIIFFSLLLIGLYFLGRHLCKTYFNEPVQKEIGLVGDEDNDDTLAYNESNQTELEQKYEEIDELIDPLNEKSDDEIDNSKLNEELNNLIDKEKNTDESDIGMGGAILLDDASKIEDGKSENSKEKESASSTKSEGVERQLNKHADIIPESGKCIIIVGSFIKSLNTIKMVSLLERKGYSVFQGEYKGFTRVGLVYECTDEDLEAFLQDIRKKISGKAWYLDPELEVPYLK